MNQRLSGNAWSPSEPFSMEVCSLCCVALDTFIPCVSLVSAPVDGELSQCPQDHHRAGHEPGAQPSLSNWWMVAIYTVIRCFTHILFTKCSK